MYINSYKYIYSDNTELPDLVDNSFHQIQAIEDIKNSLKRSAEEFEAKQLLKKTKLISSTHVSNLSYPTGTLTNDISYIEQVKNSSSNTNEVSEIIDKEIEFLCTQKSSIKDDKFEKIIEELFPCELNNKEVIIESEICDPVVLFSNVDQETHLQSPPSTDILSLAWYKAVLSCDNNLESEANERTVSSDVTNDASSSSDPTREINEKIPEPMKLSWKNSEYRKMRTQAVRQSWEDEKNKKKKLSKVMKRKWKDPEYKKMMYENINRRWGDPEYREPRVETMRQKWKDPEYRKMMCEARWKTQKPIQNSLEAFTTETFVVKKPTKTYQRLRKP